MAAPEAVPLPSAPRVNTGYSLSQNIAPFGKTHSRAGSSPSLPLHYRRFVTTTG
jgi:hypothetical protein